jgi:hypothetical protein
MLHKRCEMRSGWSRNVCGPHAGWSAGIISCEKRGRMTGKIYK